MGASFSIYFYSYFYSKPGQHRSIIKIEISHGRGSMNSIASYIRETDINVGEVVMLADDLLGVPAPGGELIPAEKLGPGVVEQLTPDGAICVRWLDAGITCCIDYADLRPLGGQAHVITMMKCDRRGTCTLARRKIAERLGLQHNWTVEMRDRNIVRVLRDDGLTWTFTRNPIFNTISIDWPQPPEDDDAEALIAAELASKR